MPQIFGWQHLIYVAVSVVFAVAVLVCAKLFVKTEKAKEIVMRCAGALLFVAIFVNRMVLVFEHGQPNWMKLITDSFCSTSSYALGITLMVGKKDNNVLHFLWLIALAGGAITTFAPNFIGQNPAFLYPPTILGLIHHTLSAIIVIMMLMFGYLKITYKKWYCTLWGFASYFTYGAFLMCVLGFGNPFYMTAPVFGGTPLTAWVIAPIYVVGYALILLTVELVRRKLSRKQAVVEKESSSTQEQNN